MHPSKGQFDEPSHLLHDHLGLEICTAPGTQGSLRVPAWRANKVRALARQLLSDAAHQRQRVSSKLLRSFAGCATSTSLAVRSARFHLRGVWDSMRESEFSVLHRAAFTDLEFGRVLLRSSSERRGALSAGAGAVDRDSRVGRPGVGSGAAPSRLPTGTHGCTPHAGADRAGLLGGHLGGGVAHHDQGAQGRALRRHVCRVDGGDGLAQPALESAPGRARQGDGRGRAASWCVQSGGPRASGLRCSPWGACGAVFLGLTCACNHSTTVAWSR